jgi:hypothetical protein
MDSDTKGFNFEAYISNRPLTHRFRLTDRAYLPCYYKSGQGDAWLIYSIYSGSTVTASGIITTTPSGNAGYLGYAPDNINDKLGAGTIDENTTHYTIGLLYSTGGSFDTIKVVLDHSCTDSHTMLCFSSKYGFLEYYLFRGDRIRNTQVKRSDITNPEGINFTVSRETQKHRVTNINKRITYTISSGVIKEEDALYLEQVLEADYAYVIDNSEYVPVSILGVKRVVEDKVKGISSIVVEYELDVTDRQGLGAPAEYAEPV